jgi:hypothetical protein
MSNSPLLLKGRTRTTTLIFPAPPGAIFALYPMQRGGRQQSAYMETGLRKWDAGGDRGTPMRELREERGSKGSRRVISAELERCEFFVIDRGWTVAGVEWVGVNKDVMYRSNIGSASLMLFLWVRVLGGAEAWILQVGDLSTKARQPQTQYARSTKNSKMRLWSSRFVHAEKPHESPERVC